MHSNWQDLISEGDWECRICSLHQSYLVCIHSNNWEHFSLEFQNKIQPSTKNMAKKGQFD